MREGDGREEGEGEMDVKVLWRKEEEEEFKEATNVVGMS